MSELRICFEVQGFGVDESGNPCPVGMQISLGNSDKDIPYSVLTESINMSRILELACLDGLTKSENVKIISPEEYDTRYGDK